MHDFFIVPTPIGNLEDISSRALSILNKVDFIVCEDTRQTSKLLKHYNISKPLFIYNDLSKSSNRNKIIKQLNDSKTGAIVSDAGTPLICDPGYKLIREIRNKNFRISVLPGPCSLISALVLSGLPTDSFFFGGYLPSKLHAKQNTLKNFINLNTTLIFFETKNRITESLESILQIFGDIEISIVREVSKIYEETLNGSATEVLEQISKKPLLGELILLISNINNNIISEDELKDYLNQQKLNLSTKDVVKIASEKFNLSKTYIYKIAKNL